MSVSNLDAAKGVEGEFSGLVNGGLVTEPSSLSLMALHSARSGVGSRWEEAIAPALTHELEQQAVLTLTTFDAFGEAMLASHWGDRAIVSASDEAHVLSEGRSTDLVTNFESDPLTGEFVPEASMQESPAYSGYLLIYEPGQPLEFRPEVAQWQARMRERGWTIAVDGLYGPESERVARQFQQEKGLMVDGIVGAETWQAAFAPVDPVDPTIENPVDPGRINTEGLELIKEFEGLRLNSYQDAVGVWTIGYGHTRTAGPGQSITLEQATALLREDVANFENVVTQAVQVPITANQFAALVSFTYNVGSGALNSSTLLRKLNAGDTLGAADEFLRWNRAGGQELTGLTRRRIAERELFLS